MCGSGGVVWCRMMAQPDALLELSGHTHWVWNCCYSPFFDQLLLSSSTDTTVCMWYTPVLARLKGLDTKQLSSRAASR
jgi:WD40 repeat protein